MADETSVRVCEDERPGWARLVLSGQVTVAGAREFHSTARELIDRGTSVAVRCEAVEHLDTSAIQILLSLGRELVARGRQFDLGGVPDALAENFRLAGLAKPRA